MTWLSIAPARSEPAIAHREQRQGGGAGDWQSPVLDDAEERMQKSVESFRNELATVRTGRASPHLLDRVIVDR